MGIYEENIYIHLLRKIHQLSLLQDIHTSYNLQFLFTFQGGQIEMSGAQHAGGEQC